jgi:hypothetical protein
LTTDRARKDHLRRVLSGVEIENLVLVRGRREASKVMGEMKTKIAACAFGTLLAAMLVPGGVARADDADFNNYLQAHGINLGSPAQAVNMAHVMCQDLDAGYSQKDEVDQLTGSHKLTQQQAEAFIGAATAEYCPGKHSPNKPS